MSIKIFCDIAEHNKIKIFNKKKIVKGFTTNPSLMRKAGAKDYKSYAKKILKICNHKPVSLEVFGDNYIQMKKQALEINKWGKNVYVKIPVLNSKGIFPLERYITSCNLFFTTFTIFVLFFNLTLRVGRIMSDLRFLK